MSEAGSGYVMHFKERMLEKRDLKKKKVIWTF